MFQICLSSDVRMSTCKTSPMKINHKLRNGVEEGVDQKTYQRLVGKPIYLSHTKPDIDYAVRVVSQYMHYPRKPHLRVLIVLTYLKSAPGKGLLFSNNSHMKIEAFTNANWAESPDDTKSTVGYCTIV